MRSVHHERLTRALFAAVFSILVVAGTGSGGSSAARPAAAPEDAYTVFCVNRKLDFNDSTLEKMRWDYGKDVCEKGKFNSYKEAREYVRRNGGVGATCTCP